MTRYTDYCPIGTGIDVIGDRWTPLVIREMSVGSTGFNEIHRGIPRISRTLLSQRLRVMERRGLINREVVGQGRSTRYTLTPIGEELVPIVWQIGHWAARWLYAESDDERCSGETLLWRLHQASNVMSLPKDRVVVHVILTGEDGAEGWLDIDAEGMTVCKDDQGKDVDLVIEGDTRQLYRWISGMTQFRELVSAGDVRLIGPSRLARAFPGWFRQGMFGDEMRATTARLTACPA